MHLIEDHAAEAGIPVRFAASKLVEGDALILDALKLSDNEKEMMEHIVLQMEEEGGVDRAAAIADMRFSFINDVCEKAVVKPRESKEHIRSQKLDKKQEKLNSWIAKKQKETYVRIDENWKNCDFEHDGWIK